MNIIKRIIRVLKWVVIASVTLVALLAIVVGVLNYVAGSKLEQRLVAISDLGQPRSLSELASAAVPPEENAFVVLTAEEETMNDFINLVWELEYGELRSSENDEVLATACTDNADLLTKLRVASFLDHADPSLDFDAKFEELYTVSLKTIEPLRTVARCLTAEGNYHLHEEDFDLALADANAILRWSSLAAHQPFSVGYLTALAARQSGLSLAAAAIYQGAEDSDELAELTRLLDQFESNRTGEWNHTIVSERVFGLASFEQMPRFWYFINMALDYLDLLEGALQNPHLTPREFSDLLRVDDGSLAALSFPMTAGLHETYCRMTAKSRSLRALVAWSTQGKTATGIDDLDMPSDQTIDPYNGLPLRWKATDDGPVIYSVSRDEVDDDGQVADGPTTRAFDDGVGPRQDSTP